MLQRRSGAWEGLQPSHGSEGLVQTKSSAQAQKGQTVSPSVLIFLALCLEQRECRPLGAASFEQRCSLPYPRDTRFRGCQRIFTQCVYYCWPFAAQHQPFPGSISTSSIRHQVSYVLCQGISSWQRKPHGRFFFLLCRLWWNTVQSVWKTCLNHFHQWIHFSLA